MTKKTYVTMPQFVYKIDKVLGGDFESQCSKLIAMAKALPYLVIRMTFFGNPKSQEEYLEHLQIIKDAIERNFDKKKPVFSYVSQPPLMGDLILETTRVAKSDDLDIKYKNCGDTPYIKITSSRNKYVFVGGVMGSNILKQSISAQCCDVFKKLDAVLSKEGLKVDDIVRQWNYIEKITSMTGGVQNYQSFNDQRTHFYAEGEWVNGYPAATGIGTRFGGIVVDFDAVKTKSLQIVALDNELQVPAHAYSQDVLLGKEDKTYKEKTTPKFERGKSVSADKGTIGYISGTAAIRGEESLESMDINRQVVVTMENIDFLMSTDNLKKYGVKTSLGKPQYRTLRVYLKNSADVVKVSKYMNENYPAANKCYLLADVCRDELLIEIEGMTIYE